MKSDLKVIAALNDALTNHLTAVNQFFLHARLLDNWGFTKLGKAVYEASINEMKFADQIIKRILFLEGLPNLQLLNKLCIGQDVEEIITSDLHFEGTLVPILKDHISTCETKEDFVTRNLLESILAKEEDYLDFLETQRSLLSELGTENYCQSQMED